MVKFYFYTREASKHQRCVSVFVLVAVDIGSVLQKQFAHVRLSLVGCVHERTHPILTRNSTKKKKPKRLCFMQLHRRDERSLFVTWPQTRAKQLALTSRQTTTTSRRTWSALANKVLLSNAHVTKTKERRGGHHFTLQSPTGLLEISGTPLKVVRNFDTFSQFIIIISYKHTFWALISVPLPHPNSWLWHPCSPVALTPLARFLKDKAKTKFNITAVWIQTRPHVVVSKQLTH